MSQEAVDAFLGNAPFPHDAIRSRLMKQGGPGYMPPAPGSFPPLDEVVAAIRACGALPCYAFLDGTSNGEDDMHALLEGLVARGIAAMVVIPDRNWNVPDAARSRDLAHRLDQALQAAAELNIPVFIGTEMNRPGQLLVDDLSVPALCRHIPQFRRGADLLYAHSVLSRRFGLGLYSQWAEAKAPFWQDRVRLYTALGQLLSPQDDSVERAGSLLATSDIHAALQALAHRDRTDTA